MPLKRAITRMRKTMTTQREAATTGLRRMRMKTLKTIMKSTKARKPSWSVT